MRTYPTDAQRFQFEVPPPYIPGDYHDGMRGYAPPGLAGWNEMRGTGGIFRHSTGLHGFGDATADPIAEFNAKYANLRNEVLVAAAQYAGAGAADWQVNNFNNNIGIMDRIAGQVRAGNIGKSAAVSAVANQLIADAKDLADAHWWSNLPSVEDIVHDLADLPRRFGVAMEDTLYSKTGIWLGIFGLGLAYVVVRALGRETRAAFGR